MLLLLLQTIESEDDRAFLMDIYQQHYHKLYKEADSIVHNAYDAEDVVQEFMIYICDHINKFRALECCVLPSYLVMCIRRRCINFLKRRETQKKHTIGSIDNEQYFFDYPDTEISVEEKVLLNLKFEQVQEAFSQLPQSTRDILQYKYFLELTDAEIAELLGIQKNSVRAYLTRARKAVCRICEENGYV